jgi:hypothetical protein
MTQAASFYYVVERPVFVWRAGRGASFSAERQST